MIHRARVGCTYSLEGRTVRVTRAYSHQGTEYVTLTYLDAPTATIEMRRALFRGLAFEPYMRPRK